MGHGDIGNYNTGELVTTPLSLISRLSRAPSLKQCTDIHVQGARQARLGEAKYRLHQPSQARVSPRSDDLLIKELRWWPRWAPGCVRQEKLQRENVRSTGRTSDPSSCSTPCLARHLRMEGRGKH